MHVPASPASFAQSERTVVENYPECIVEEEDKADFEVEGPIRHFAIIKLACLDIMAGFTLTIGFSIIGSGVCGLNFDGQTNGKLIKNCSVDVSSHL